MKLAFSFLTSFLAGALIAFQVHAQQPPDADGGRVGQGARQQMGTQPLATVALVDVHADLGGARVRGPSVEGREAEPAAGLVVARDAVAQREPAQLLVTGLGQALRLADEE